VQVLTVGLGCLLPGLVLGGYAFGVPAWGAAAFTGVGATAVAVLCMVWAQRVVPPARTAIILLLEPVFAALLGYVTGERLGGRGFLGAGLILGAVLWTELVPDRAGDRPRPHHADV
jgi:drug/metabolite transporter (DMT)-like permease